MNGRILKLLAGMILALAAIATITLPIIASPKASTPVAASSSNSSNDGVIDALTSNNRVDDFTSNIPVVVLRAERNGPVSSSKTYSSFKLEIYEPVPNEPARLRNPPTVSTRTGLRLHGQVSRLFPKLSYRLQLQDGAGRKEQRSLLGMPADADWVLQGPWLDKSLIRNAFSYDLARAMGCSAMRTRPCEVFLSTSGQPLRRADYIGVYQLTEQIKRGEQRVNIAGWPRTKTRSR